MTYRQPCIASICPRYHRAIELIGRRWTGAIVLALLQGATRFSDIAHSVPGLSDRLLSERLKELECEGIVKRTVYAEIPVRIEYHLTDQGMDLSTIVDAVGCWAIRWLPDPGETAEEASLDLDQETEIAL